jgi:hypothetical protein
LAKYYHHCFSSLHKAADHVNARTGSLNPSGAPARI